MSYLLYCIFSTPEEEELCLQSKSEILLGVGREPVSLVSNKGLTAAITAIKSENLASDFPNLLAYKKVIEIFYRNWTVIPVRYGSLFRDKPQIIQLLGERQALYKTLLKELEGCVEMGIRTLVPKRAMTDGEAGMDALGAKSENPQSPTDYSQSPMTGRAYIATLKAKYAQKTQLNHETEEIMSRVCEMFTGLFVKCQTESTLLLPFSHPPLRTPLLSLYFLVPKGMVEAFRQTFQKLVLKEGGKFLLSGPWPPYNFVLPEPSLRPLGRE